MLSVKVFLYAQFKSLNGIAFLYVYGVVSGMMRNPTNMSCMQPSYNYSTGLPYNQHPTLFGSGPPVPSHPVMSSLPAPVRYSPSCRQLPPLPMYPAQWPASGMSAGPSWQHSMPIPSCSLTTNAVHTAATTSTCSLTVRYVQSNNGFNHQYL